MKNISFLIAISFLIGIIACEHEVIEPTNAVVPIPSPSNDCDSNKVYFNKDILPIFVSNCAFSGCHDIGTASDDVILTTYQNVMQSDVVKGGDLNGSDLYEVITETDPNKRMPKGGNPLPQDLIDNIKDWILEGAPNSLCNNGCDTNNTTFSTNVKPIIKLKCEGCHSGSNLGGGISLVTFTEIQNEALSLRLPNVITHQPGFKAMPLGGAKLPDCEIETIKAWIDAGSPNN